MKKISLLICAAILMVSGCSRYDDYKTAYAYYLTEEDSGDVSSTMDISEIVIDYIPNADDMTYVREATWNYDEQKAKYEQMLPTDYTDIPQEMTYGIMTDIDNLMVSHMKYVNDNGKTDVYTDREGEKIATLDYIDTQKAEIVFENGSIASEEDLMPGSAVFVEYDLLNETYPGTMRCTRIVILQQ